MDKGACMGDEIRYEVTDPVATITLARPATLNALTYGMLAIGLVLVYRSAKFINFAHIGIGILGEYLGRVYDEVKRRPPYVVKRSPGGPRGPAAPAAFADM